MSVKLMLLQTALFAAAWKTLSHHIAIRGPIRGARRLTALNSHFYSLASLGMFLLIISGKSKGLAKYTYHASKFYEYLDILNVIASGGEIDLHFGFHHLTTPYLTYFRVIQYSDGWEWFAILNTFHHVLMYAYFGGVARMRPVLTYTGTLQLVVGILVEYWQVWTKWKASDDVLWPNIFSLSLLSAYLMLWTRDLRMRAQDETESATADKTD